MNIDYNRRLRDMAEARAKRIHLLRAKKMPWREIAELEGCSRQRLWELLKRFKLTKP